MTSSSRLNFSIGIQIFLYRFLARIGVHLHTRDQEIADRFHRRRENFERIKAMLFEDSRIGYIDHNKTRIIGEDNWRVADNPGITIYRWAEYRDLLSQLGVIAVSHVGETLTMRISNCGSSSKGIVYCPAHRVLVSSLELYPLPPEKHAHILLQEPWHIYYGWKE